ncbi:unnamed protein product [Staurois parvus]|uniref:Uncharacterized protein n=1 Tax=Staurois parvus TaxID=386267 RepID=A0ABN9D9M7_9NEOB|nr:unnamed protein product [Staurois parvus]
MSLLQFFKFPASSVLRMSRCSREQNPEDRCRHPPEDITGDTAGGDIAGAQDKVSEEEIPEQRCSVFPSVARGYRFWC